MNTKAFESKATDKFMILDAYQAPMTLPKGWKPKPIWTDIRRKTDFIPCERIKGSNKK